VDAAEQPSNDSASLWRFSANHDAVAEHLAGRSIIHMITDPDWQQRLWRISPMREHHQRRGVSG
jgi:hypothetical protein